MTNFTVPYHPGAIQFYKEARVWTAKQEARIKGDLPIAILIRTRSVNNLYDSR